MLCRHDPRREPLVDPMAGSGTIAIEAALMARGAPLWVAPRRPAADRIPGFADPCAGEALFADTEPAVLASDVDPDAVALAQRAANRAGAAGDVSIACDDFRDLTPADVFRRLGRRSGGTSRDRGVILANPPYGHRLGGDELEDLYRDLGAWCRQFSGWRAGFLVANDAFLPAFGGRPRIEKPIRAGGLSARFCLYDL